MGDSRQVVLSRLASESLLEIVKWYKEQGEWLAAYFIGDFEKALNFVEEFPLALPIVMKEEECRRCMFKNFPHALIFRCYEKEIVIFKIIDMRGNPDVWKDQIKRLTS